MKINGRVLTQPKAGCVVIPRQDGDIVFKVETVLDYSRYEKLCIAPKAPELKMPDGSINFDTSDFEYLKKLEEFATYKTSFLIFESLKNNNIEWETVKENDPTTWGNIEEELSKSFFLPIEIDLIFKEIIKVNGLSDTIYKEARERFLAGEKEGLL